MQQGECLEAMEQLKSQGKIRYWGLSLNTFYPEPEADFLLEKNLGDGFQLVFNLMNQRALTTIEKAAKMGCGVIARMPLQFGLLTGKFTEDATFNSNDHRSFRLTKEILSKTLTLLKEKVWPVAEEENLSPTSLAMSFILSYPEISTVIPGIRTPQHVQQNTEGIKLLQPEDRSFLESLTAQWEEIVKLMEKQG